MPRKPFHFLDRYPLLGTAAVSSFIVLAFLILHHLPLWHTDLWAHLRFGDWIKINGRLPETEPFSPWSDPKPYVPMAWLSQVILSYVYEWGQILTRNLPTPARTAWEGVAPGGVDGLRFVFAATVTLRLLLLFYAYRRIGQSCVLALLGVLFCLSMSMTHIDVFRPQIFGELCLATMLFAVCKPEPRMITSLLIPLLFGLWANLHGSFFNGLLVLLGVMASRFFLEVGAHKGVCWGKLYHSAPMRRIFRMFLFSILAVGFLNPQWGFGWYREALSFANHPNVAGMDEWQRLDWHSPSGWAFSGSLVVVFGTHLLARMRGKQGISFGHWLLVICFGLQVVFFQRMLPWWAMLAPYVCLGPWRRITESGSGEEVSPGSSGRRWMSLCVVILALWVSFAWSPMGKWFLHKQVSSLEQALYPGTPRALPQLAYRSSAPVGPLAEALRKPIAPIFASETLGDYLLFSLPQRPCLIYTHVHLFSADHWQKCLTIKRGEGDWQKVLDEWNVKILMVEAELHPQLCEKVRQSFGWIVVLDEKGMAAKADPKARHFLAVRK